MEGLTSARIGLAPDFSDEFIEEGVEITDLVHVAALLLNRQPSAFRLCGVGAFPLLMSDKPLLFFDFAVGCQYLDRCAQDLSDLASWPDITQPGGIVKIAQRLLEGIGERLG